MEETKRSFGDDVRKPEAASDKPSRFSLFRKAKPSPSIEFKGDALATLYAHHHHGDGASFGQLLRESAAAIENGRALINARGREIARAIASAGSTDTRLASWGARLLIALFWVFIGVVLAREAGSGYGTRGLDPASASSFARIFMGAGVLGAAVAMVGGFMARASDGNRMRGAEFGAEAGAIVRAFGERAADLRARIADENSAAAASDISRLHLIAMEATSFLEGINFLAEPDHQRASEKFRAFLAGGRAPGGASPGAALLLLLLLGAIVGISAAMGGGSFGALPLWIAIALPGFAMLYAGLGLLFALAGADAAGGASAGARDDMLTRLRKAYVAAGAPRADDIIDDVEAALQTIGRRIGGEHHHAARAENDSNLRNLAPRNADASPRFVAQSFEAAPPVFRPERQANFRKNFFTGGRRSAEPKQSRNAPDAPPWLKD